MIHYFLIFTKMAHHPQTIGSAVKQFEDYIEPDYEVGTGYASPAEIRGEVNAFVNSVLLKHLGGDNGTKPIAPRAAQASRNRSAQVQEHAG